MSEPFSLHLLSHTNEPLKAIAAAIENIGIGSDTTNLDDMTYEAAKDKVADTVKSYLSSPLEYASFNFFVQNVPIFIIREWVRARIGWSYAERSLRFFQLDETILEKIDRRFYPSLDDDQWVRFLAICRQEIGFYLELKERYGFETQEARNVLGVWVPTQLQVAGNYRAIRDTMGLRLSSQAHPGWQLVAGEIKKRITEVDQFLGENITDICGIQGRCVWHSRLDRPCDDCMRRGREPNHSHSFTLQTKAGTKQCSCGQLETEV